MIPGMAVAGYFFFDEVSRIPPNGTQPVLTDWDWAMAQWDKVAAAWHSVRLVVVDPSYLGLAPTKTVLNKPNAPDMMAKFTACHNAGQLVFGYVAGNGGAIPLINPPAGGPPWWLAPRASAWPNPLTGPVAPAAAGAKGAYMSLQGQIDAWHSTYPGLIDGIYVDEGPTDCLSNSFAANVPSNYASYCTYIRQLNYKIFLLAAGYPDNDNANANLGWFQKLQWDYVGLWEADLPAYENSFGATDYCNSPNFPTIPAPSWWDPANAGFPEKRITRVHIINGGIDAEATNNKTTWAAVLTKVENFAVSHGSGTISITERWKDTSGNEFYGFLPDYWADEVWLFTPPCYITGIIDTAPEAATLRAFRDERLAHHALGRAFIKNYYRHGPKLAALSVRFPILKSATRRIIRACIRLFG